MTKKYLIKPKKAKIQIIETTAELEIGKRYYYNYDDKPLFNFKIIGEFPLKSIEIPKKVIKTKKLKK